MEFEAVATMEIAGASRNRRTIPRAARIHSARLAYSYFPVAFMNDGVEPFDYSQDFFISPDARSTPYRRLLYFIAVRILGGRDEAEQAVAGCLAKASANPSTLDNEGAFRSWLIRLLISEALLLLAEKGND